MSPACQFPPVVTITADAADLDEGETLSLNCHYSASPSTLEAVTFTHNGQEVSLETVTRGDNVVRMVVTNVTGDQAGASSLTTRRCQCPDRGAPAPE